MQKTFFKKTGEFTSGYTIIETMIAISLFLVIVMLGMGALLNANLLHQKSRDVRSIMDSLSFIMEDMSRNLRTGFNYRCYESGAWSQTFAQSAALNTPQSCTSGGVIIFEEAHGLTPTTTPTADPDAHDQWGYKIETAGGTTFNIYKSTTGGGTPAAPDWVQLNPDELVLDLTSGFSVLGAESPTSASLDKQQPLIVIKLAGTITIKNKNISTPFYLQTSVSQRLIDI